VEHKTLFASVRENSGYFVNKINRLDPPARYGGRRQAAQTVASIEHLDLVPGLYQYGRAGKTRRARAYDRHTPAGRRAAGQLR
jgi:hypothetical protein